MTQEHLEKYPFATECTSLLRKWNNSFYAFKCMKASTLIASILLERLTFNQLLGILGTIRHLLALEDKTAHQSIHELYAQAKNLSDKISFASRWNTAFLKSPYYSSMTTFGRLRNTGLYTPISIKNCYKDMIEDLESLFYEQSPNRVSLRIRYFDSEETIYYSEIIPTGPGAFYLQHTAPEFLDSAKEVASNLLKGILNKNRIDASEIPSPEVIIKQIAVFNWHLSQATFFERGSASITELLTTALFIYKNIPLPVYKEQTTCDLKALFISSPQIFAERFMHFFDWKRDLNPVEQAPIQQEVNSSKSLP